MEREKEVRDFGHSYEVYDGAELIDTSFVMNEDAPEWILSHSKKGLEVRKL